MNGQIIEQGHAWFGQRAEEAQQEIAVLEAQRGQLEQKKARSPALILALGKFFGLGIGEKLNWLRFKLKLKQEQLDQFEAKYGVIGQLGLSTPKQVLVGERQGERRVAA